MAQDKHEGYHCNKTYNIYIFILVVSLLSLHIAAFLGWFPAMYGAIACMQSHAWGDGSPCDR